MKKLNNKSGFTLIEIIVVLIIVGVLAAIALPNLFANVAKSKGEEALASMSAYKTEIEGCLNAHPTTSHTGGCDGAGMALGTTNFTYVLSSIADGGTLPTDTYTITAGQTAANSGAGTIVLSRNAAQGFTCQGTGTWLGVC